MRLSPSFDSSGTGTRNAAPAAQQRPSSPGFPMPFGADDGMGRVTERARSWLTTRCRTGGAASQVEHSAAAAADGTSSPSSPKQPASGKAAEAGAHGAKPRARKYFEPDPDDNPAEESSDEEKDELEREEADRAAANASEDRGGKDDPVEVLAERGEGDMGGKDAGDSGTGDSGFGGRTGGGVSTDDDSDTDNSGRRKLKRRKGGSSDEDSDIYPKRKKTKKGKGPPKAPTESESAEPPVPPPPTKQQGLKRANQKPPLDPLHKKQKPPAPKKPAEPKKEPKSRPSSGRKPIRWTEAVDPAKITDEVFKLKESMKINVAALTSNNSSPLHQFFLTRRNEVTGKDEYSCYLLNCPWAWLDKGKGGLTSKMKDHILHQHDYGRGDEADDAMLDRKLDDISQPIVHVTMTGLGPSIPDERDPTAEFVVVQLADDLSVRLPASFVTGKKAAKDRGSTLKVFRAACRLPGLRNAQVKVSGTSLVFESVYIVENHHHMQAVRAIQMFDERFSHGGGGDLGTLFDGPRYVRQYAAEVYIVTFKIRISTLEQLASGTDGRTKVEFDSKIPLAFRVTALGWYLGVGMREDEVEAASVGPIRRRTVF
ncbi:hypothetical protein DFJ74DRAFT_693710 [Hyaloraphidium curvatum]|nr:hypothetical protein DFJ74DRAFT_693710 [Hyaloraphidium curvatum]